MKTRWSIIVVVLQVAVLAFMAGEREWVLRNGLTIYLRTAPVDPRDVMRGDYVRLSYEISRVPRWLCRGTLAGTNAPEMLPRDMKVYAWLRTNEAGMADLTALSDRRPDGGLFIGGRTEPFWGSQVSVRYGLEAYFMEQGAALGFERRQARQAIQVPLEMAVAVNSRGLAVLKGHRECALGIGLELATAPLGETNGSRGRQPIGARVQLLNASTNDLAVVDVPGGSLALLPDTQWGEVHWHWIRSNAPQKALGADHIIVLKPGEIHTIHVSFHDPDWFVRGPVPGSKTEEETRSLTDLRDDSSARFRFEYRPPDRAACAGLRNGQLVWHGRVVTRAFSPAGSMD